MPYTNCLHYAIDVHRGGEDKTSINNRFKFCVHENFRKSYVDAMEAIGLNKGAGMTQWTDLAEILHNLCTPNCTINCKVAGFRTPAERRSRAVHLVNVLLMGQFKVSFHLVNSMNPVPTANVPLIFVGTYDNAIRPGDAVDKESIDAHYFAKSGGKYSGVEGAGDATERTVEVVGRKFKQSTSGLPKPGEIIGYFSLA